MKLTIGLLLSVMVGTVAYGAIQSKQTEVIKRVCSCMLHHNSAKPKPSKQKPAAKPLIGLQRAALGAAIDQRCPCSHGHHHRPSSKPHAK